MFGEKIGNRPTFPVEEGKTGPNEHPLPVVSIATAKRKHEDPVRTSISITHMHPRKTISVLIGSIIGQV